jgi:plastocyanin
VSRIRSRPSLARLATSIAVLALGLAWLTACGGGTSGSSAASGSTTQSAASSAAASSAAGSSASGGSGKTEALKATEKDFSISLDQNNVKPGTYTITVVNDGNATHDLAVEKDGTTKAKSASISPGGSTTLTVDLGAGKYVFYCSIGNHRAMGMELTVQVS